MHNAIIIISAVNDSKYKLGGYGVTIHEIEAVNYYKIDMTPSIKSKLVEGYYLSNNGINRNWKTCDKETANLKVLKIKETTEISGSILEDSSLAKAESNGFLEALTFVEEKNWKSILVYCDSRYVAERLDKLFKNNDAVVLKRKDGKNITTYDIWTEITRLVLLLLSKEVNIKWQWIQDVLPKEYVDSSKLIARKGLALAHNKKEKLVIVYPEGKKKIKESRCHGFLTQSRLYFIPSIINISEGGKHYYYCGEHESKSKTKKEDLLRWCGKPRSESTMSAIILYEADPVIETIIKLSRENVDNLNNGRIIKLDAIKKAETRNNIIDYKKDLLIEDKVTNGIDYYDNTIISVEQRPPYLFFSFYEKLNSLYRRLNKYSSGVLDDNTTVLDITDYVYDKDKKGNFIMSKKLFNDKYVTVEVKKYNTKITLSMGFDLLNDLGIKRIANENPVIKLFIDQVGPKLIRYYVHIKTDKAEGLFTTTHSNSLFLT